MTRKGKYGREFYRPTKAMDKTSTMAPRPHLAGGPHPGNVKRKADKRLKKHLAQYVTKRELRDAKIHSLRIKGMLPEQQGKRGIKIQPEEKEQVSGTNGANVSA